MKLTIPQYSPTEELINTLTHGIGAFFSVIGFLLLLSDPLAADDPVRMVSYCIYGVSLILLFLSSTMYHGVKQPNLKKRFKLCDHCAILTRVVSICTAHYDEKGNAKHCISHTRRLLSTPNVTHCRGLRA